MTSLRVTDLHVSYDSVHAVRGIDLHVEDGQVLGVIGVNGAGKSTLLKAICGLVPARRGRVVLGDRDLSRLPSERRVRAGLALSPEGRGVLAGMTVRENLVLGAYAVPRAKRRMTAATLDDVADLFPVLGKRLGQQAETLSGGEAAMLSIGRALMSRPRVMLLDEPTLGLAPIITVRLFEMLKTLSDRGTTMIVVEQRATQMLGLADQVLQMKGGEAVAQSRTEDIDAETLSTLYFGAA